MAAGEAGDGRSRGGAQSLDRASAILEAMADAGGVTGLSQLASHSGLPLATIHRLVRTLVDLGYVGQEPSRQYSLGPRLMRLVEGSTPRKAPLPVHRRRLERQAACSPYPEIPRNGSGPVPGSDCTK